jgi:hypothetical protein
MLTTKKRGHDQTFAADFCTPRLLPGLREAFHLNDDSRNESRWTLGELQRNDGLAHDEIGRAEQDQRQDGQLEFRADDPTEKSRARFVPCASEL